MYLDFFGLTEKPFNTTPDPRFLYATPRHQEALARLTYAVQENKGFVALTGEIGTGKTTLLRALLRQLDPETAVAFVVNSTLPFEGLLEYVLADLGVPQPGATLAQRLIALNRFLIERRRSGRQTLLIVDEAQDLSSETLEEIRLLSNCETAGDKLLQILLVGQPEFEAKLNLPQLRQLKQRIELHVRITPLSPAETGDYIKTRLRVAGAADVNVFVANAPALIAAATGGVPRLINILCDHCLLIAYADQKRRIGGEVVQEALDSLQMVTRRPANVPKALPTRARFRNRRVAVTIVAALSAWLALVVELPDYARLSAILRTMRHFLTP